MRLGEFIVIWHGLTFQLYFYECVASMGTPNFRMTIACMFHTTIGTGIAVQSLQSWGTV